MLLSTHASRPLLHDRLSLALVRQNQLRQAAGCYNEPSTLDEGATSQADSLTQAQSWLTSPLFVLQDFHRNFRGDPKVKIPWVRRDLSGGRMLTMEWIDGLRCTDPAGIRASGLDVDEFIRCGVVSGLRQLLEVRYQLSESRP